VDEVSVYILPLRNPMAVAKAVASLDHLSNGRFMFGVGIGWLKEEFEWVGMDWDKRARRNNETLMLLEALFHSESPGFSGQNRGHSEFLPRAQAGSATSSTLYHRR
jgi:alkanesulfonate monooxygenase SsuD/methylene tetrahydromethanopterin reductase-like flavin-dependent oxidoreductase (luciferase family)